MTAKAPSVAVPREETSTARTIRLIREDERERCCKDVCMYCSGNAPGYAKAEFLKNGAGNWVHYAKTDGAKAFPSLCYASSIFVRAAFYDRLDAERASSLREVLSDGR